MKDKNLPPSPSHDAYSLIQQEGHEHLWLKVGVAFPRERNGDFKIVLQALPLDGVILCRKVANDDPKAPNPS